MNNEIPNKNNNKAKKRKRKTMYPKENTSDESSY